MRRFASAATVAVLCVFTVLTTGQAGAAPPRLRASLSVIGPQDGGGEPSIASAPDGTLYVSAPADSGMAFFRSTNQGKQWVQGAYAQDSSGDTSVFVDASGAVYQSNLIGPDLVDLLQGVVYKSFDKGETWPQIGASLLSDSNSTSNPLLVDRQWADAWIPPGKTTDEARVYISYHDFGPSQIWVNTSTDGGRTFGLPVDVINSPEAQAASFCSTIPGGLKVVQSGEHAGRVYVAWLAADPLNPATGCNLTQLQAFHTIWVAWSDDGGQSWTDHLVFDAGFFHDASELFADLTLDNQGNPYVAFALNLEEEFDVWVEASFDGGETWNGKADGSGRPYRVNSTTGTHYFPAIGAGDPGKVVVAYLRTSFVTPTAPNGKPLPAADQNADWNVHAAQSLNLLSGNPTWTAVRLTPKPMHHGDICTLGLFCSVVPGTDRNLLDFIDVVIDPAGRFNVAYTDDLNFANGALVAANQTAGPRVGPGGR